MVPSWDEDRRESWGDSELVVDTQRRIYYAFDVDHFVEVQRGFLQLLELGKHSDVTFIITEDGEDHRIPAHRVILASQSEYFDRLLFGEMKEAHPHAEIRLQDTPLKAFQLLMRYTYCGKMKIADSDLQLKFDIVRLADRFGFHFLKSALGDHLGDIVCYSNVLPIFTHADVFQLEEAKATCFTFLDTTAQSVLNEASEDFLSLPQKYLEEIVCRDSFVTEEIDVFQLVRKWLEHNNKTKDDSASLLQLVRLCEIPPKLLFAEVEPSGLFDKETMFEAVKVSCKPELERMTPRGFTESDLNLFEEEDTSYQYTYNVSLQPNWRETINAATPFTKQLHSFRPNDILYPGSTSSTSWYKGSTSSASRYYKGSTSSTVTSSNSSYTAVASSSTARYRGSTSSSGHYQGLSQAPISIIIDLSSVYLVNNIILELVKSSSPYTIQVSRDKRTWRQLINYSMMCSSRQVLWFPKQAVRYMQFVPSCKCTVQLHSCALKSEVPAFALRDPGVIAPLEPFTPLHLKTTSANSDGMAGYVVTFHQPYSISLLRLVLLRDFDEGDRMDVQVTIEGHAQVYDLKDQEFGEDIEVRFAERFAHQFAVLAKPTEEKKLQTSEEWEEQPTEKIVSYSKPAEDQPVDSYYTVQFKITFVIQAS